LVATKVTMPSSLVAGPACVARFNSHVAKACVVEHQQDLLDEVDVDLQVVLTG
jgi:hypothetical protein